jgi:type I restriction enzyme, S subunit
VDLTKSLQQYTLSEGELLVGMTGAYIGRVGLVPPSHPAPMLNQRVGKFTSVENTTFLYIMTNSDLFRETIAQNAHGSAQPNISASRILSIPVILAPTKIMKAYNDICEPFLRKILKNVGEARTLAETRDALLPRLVSGEMRIPHP